MPYGLVVILVLAAAGGAGTAIVGWSRLPTRLGVSIAIVLVVTSAGILSWFAPLGDEYPGAPSRLGIFIALTTLGAIGLYLLWFLIKALRIVRG